MNLAQDCIDKYTFVLGEKGSETAPDFHTHTTFSDGRHSPEAMVMAAIKKGMPAMGISDHAYTSIDESYCLQKKNISVYQKEIRRLKEKYQNRIRIFCGIEQDYYADFSADDYDYAIGSVHYIMKDDAVIPVDETPEILLKAAEKYFQNDIYALVETYFATVSHVISKTNADIIGHFDLISKFSEKAPLFDTEHPRYVEAWQSAADILLDTHRPFEINTGAMARGYRSTPYPDDAIRNYISRKGGRFILSGDAHCASGIGYLFEQML